MTYSADMLGRESFILQWHLTAKCKYNCQHCYMHNSPDYASELDNELDLDTCLKIIDDFNETLNHWEIPGRINFTGGDPLLKKEIFELIKYASEKEISIGILGNPDEINFLNAKKLKDLGVSSYQLSIDGMEETHDRLRGKKGAFKEVIRAIHSLENAGTPSVIMFTLSKSNAYELIDVIKLAAREGVSEFDFARLVPVGRAENSAEEMLKPYEYRALLLQVLECYKELQEKGCEIKFGRKDNLWRLLYQELGLLKPLPNDRVTIFSGCGIGINILAISADGTVYPCRRLPIGIGKVPQKSIRDIFIKSEVLNKMRDTCSLKKCNKCDLRQFCRGCPAVAYGYNRDYMAEDPQCWKKVIHY